MSTTLLCTLLLLFTITTSPCFSLTVYYTNITTTPPTPTSITLPSVWATVGNLPTKPAHFNATIMQHETCHFMIDMTGYAFVYTGDLRKDMFLACNTFDKGSGVTVARLAQHAGASFVVIGAAYKVYLSVKHRIQLYFCNTTSPFLAVFHQPPTLNRHYVSMLFHAFPRSTSPHKILVF